MEYFLGEIRLFPYAGIPSGAYWVPCNGQSLPIAQNQALYSLIGIQFGGDGQRNFNLPNLNGRTIIGRDPYTPGYVYKVGDKGGQEMVPLSISELPAHNHLLYAVKNYDTSVPGTNFLGNPNIPNVPPAKQNTGTVNIYAPTGGATTILNQASIGTAGAGSGHDNRMPFLALIYCICTAGALYPPRP